MNEQLDYCYRPTGGTTITFLESYKNNIFHSIFDKLVAFFKKL